MVRKDCPTCGRAALVLRRRTDTDVTIFYCKACDFACCETENTSVSSCASPDQKAA
jgi:hypothetical protein